MPGLKPFVEVGADTRKHDLQFDRFGVQRNSDGWTAKGGTTFEFSRKLTGEVAIGWIDAQLRGPVAAGAERLPVRRLADLFDERAHQGQAHCATTVASETTVAGTSGVLTRNAGIEVEHAFRRWLIGAVKFNYGLDDYVGSTAQGRPLFGLGARSPTSSTAWRRSRASSARNGCSSTLPGNDYAADRVPARHAAAALSSPSAAASAPRGTPARCRRARARRRRWRRGIRSSSRSRRCGPRTGSRRPAASRAARSIASVSWISPPAPRLLVASRSKISGCRM